MLPKKTSSGFTLIEMMFVMTLMGILFTIGVSKYMEFNRRQIVVQETRKFKSNLRLAQSKALNGDKGQTCGNNALDGWYVRFNSAQLYEIFGKCGVTEFSNQTFSLNPKVAANPLPTTIIFKPTTQGVMLQAGSLPLSVNFQGLGIGSSVVISASGEIK